MLKFAALEKMPGHLRSPSEAWLTEPRRGGWDPAPKMAPGTSAAFPVPRQVTQVRLCNVSGTKALLKMNTPSQSPSQPIPGDSETFYCSGVLFYQMLLEDKISFGWKLQPFLFWWCVGR